MKDLDENTGATAPRQLFERSVQGLDPATANRLRLARRAALADGGAPRVAHRIWAPALATAALLVLALALWPQQRASKPALVSVPTTASQTASDLAELAEDSEDAELYAWLGEAPVAAEADPERPL